MPPPAAVPPSTSPRAPETVRVQDESVRQMLTRSRELTPKLLGELQNALSQRVQGDGNLPTLITDLRAGDRVEYNEGNQSVTVYAPD